MSHKIISIFIFFFLFNEVKLCQDDSVQTDSIEVFLIDSYISPDKANLFILSFYTSDTCKSKVIINEKHEFNISSEFKENHRTEIDLSNFKFSLNKIPFTIITENSNGKNYSSEKFELQINSENNIEAKGNYMLNCLLGGMIFLIPQPDLIIKQSKSYFALTKELPIVTHFSGGYNYPQSYISIEYSHIFKLEQNNLMRFGLKHLFEIPFIEFVSVGMNYYTNLKGSNGLSPEVSLGLLQLNSTFTLYMKYRFNFSPSINANEFHEINVGLFSSFFSFHF